MASQAQASDTKTKEDLENLISSFAVDENTGTLRNGLALYLCSKHKLNGASSALDTNFMQRDSGYVSNKKAVYDKLKKINIRLTSLKKNVRLNWHIIERFVMEPVNAPVQKKKTQPSVSPVTTTDKMLEETSQEENPPPAKKLRKDCKQCSSVREECKSKCQFLESKLKDKQVIIKTMSKKYQVQYVNKEKKRLFGRLAKLKNKIVSLKSEVRELKKNLAHYEASLTFKRENAVLAKKGCKLTSKMQVWKENLKASKKEMKDAMIQVEQTG